MADIDIPIGEMPSLPAELIAFLHRRADMLRGQLWDTAAVAAVAVFEQWRR